MNMQMYTLPQAKRSLLHEGLQTTNNILPIVFCLQGHEVHCRTAMYNLWVRNKHQKIHLFFFSPPHIWHFCVQATFISRKQRSSEKPLLYVVYSAHMADVFALQLKQGQSYTLTCTLKHCLAPVFKLLTEVTHCITNKLSIFPHRGRLGFYQRRKKKKRKSKIKLFGEGVLNFIRIKHVL